MCTQICVCVSTSSCRPPRLSSGLSCSPSWRVWSPRWTRQLREEEQEKEKSVSITSAPVRVCVCVCSSSLLQNPNTPTRRPTVAPIPKVLRSLGSMKQSPSSVQLHTLTRMEGGGRDDKKTQVNQVKNGTTKLKKTRSDLLYRACQN